ncbi:family 78 glycoside hydrolase catalytic domain [Echinicola shivajiensis]|uniref:family 78 glycoside hydrolase catalytic domain n=1 Tax=Echinicola shivajiensis TaxID=1035916 RepID=UPI001BFC210B|nr:family 78 glycoside hydrolase catalytic domain [Echinicola shivajiensis]
MMGKVAFTLNTSYLRYFLFLFGFLVFKVGEARQVSVEELNCDYLVNPIGLDNPTPSFSWILTSNERAVYQESYRVIVDEQLQNVKSKSGKVWDSGQVLSERSVNIDYGGGEFNSNATYYWRVGIRTKEGEEYWSDPASFHTALLHKEDWVGKWISTREKIEDASPVFRKPFKLDQRVRRAHVFVTACGFYELYLNGEKVGDHVLDPAVTDYRKRILYSTFDVGGDLKKGENVLGVMLGNGAYNMRKTEGRYSWGSGGEAMGNPSFILQLHLEYVDGSREVIITDESWKYTQGPITFNNIYGGEDYDANKEVEGWFSSGMKEKGNWFSAQEALVPGGKLVSQTLPAIKVTKTISPINSIRPGKGIYLFDLGQNIAGWWQIKVKGKAGQSIRVRGSETLNDVQFPKPLENGDRLSEKFDYHSKTWTDYTLKGGEEEVYEPHFFYSGFRYIEVATSDGLDLEGLEVKGRVVRTALERNSTFNSSNALLNQIHKAGIWSQKGNTVGYPTDCPHREKGAYNGDGQVIAETSMHDFNMAPFYYKWLDDMRDSQEENGRIPNTSPTLIGGMGGGVAWGSAYILIPYWMNHYYDDIRILKEHYPNMKKYLQYLVNLAKTDKVPEEEYIINDFMSYWYSLGEWCSPGMSDGPNHPVVNTFYFFYNAKLMAEIAAVLGEREDARYFSSLSDTIKMEFNKKFFNPNTFLYGTDSTYQTYQLLALAGDLVPENMEEKVLKTVVDDVLAREKHLNTGIIGTKYLWPVLENGNQTGLAYEVATQRTYPSFGYWLDNNSTTLLEKFNGDNSHNHQMFGSVVEYFYKYLAGIRSPLEEGTSKGYKQIYLAPSVPKGLNFVNASLETVSGKIVSHWEKTTRSFAYMVELPANTRGKVAIPVLGNKIYKLKEGDSVVWENGRYKAGVDGIIAVEREGDRLMIDILSGKYDFELDYSQGN